MIPNQNCEIYASVLFYLIIKIYSFLYSKYISGMYNKRQPTLTSIPERNETEEELILKKWVPKKKHEVLKAKYKCLKKLFQIYDASVIGILPEALPEQEEEQHVRKRRKRSHRTKTDACAGTREVCNGDIAHTDSENQSIATAVMKDLNLNQYSCTSTQIESINSTKKQENAECQCQCINPPILPYVVMNEKRKLTRFQCFIQRLFGIRRESNHKNHILPNGHVYAASDNNFNCSFWEKRRRRGLRFRRLRRPKKINSDGAIKDMRSSMILTYVQSVQRNCLMDTTPRHCPIVGCRMMFYGIINYNDHLNLCHFTDRKFICLYCHEGFDNEYNKLSHEYEHIGISKLNANISSAKCSTKKVVVTQTDPDMVKCDIPEEKLKKIVSFFDKISDPEQIFTEIKKKRCSESNLHKQSKTQMTESSDTSSTDKRTVSCVNLHRRVNKGHFTSSADSEVTSAQPCGSYGSPNTCRLCGEHFNYRRQLSLHVDLEHRVHNKFSKFHSCAGLMSYAPSKRVDMVSTDGQIKVHSMDPSSSVLGGDGTESSITEDIASRVKSEESMSCDPSTNIIYYTSQESVTTPRIRQCVQGIKTPGYKWEPGTRIIRV
ncbi:hypothetical protein K1T71_014112 [Dendrolimus kikuchii]|uniref:Uncharacterized protein n=1 Tax=Dendrolimus kikuchii TaxID=765133 RepID=A0ACC1CFD9_9NEOP|nr:hypothetical protein K1T71_014112 [Dendrolimus kikuchii]